jgi:hypothetical protein
MKSDTAVSSLDAQFRVVRVCHTFRLAQITADLCEDCFSFRLRIAYNQSASQSYDLGRGYQDS